MGTNKRTKETVAARAMRQPSRPRKALVARFPDAANVAEAKAGADLFLSPVTGGAAVASVYLKAPFGEQDMSSLVSTLTEQTEKLKANDLSDCEALLFGQAQALQAMFVSLARRAIVQKGLAQYEAHMRMALRAQNQARMTLETLATIKNPPTIFARQANIATGHQQINNGSRVGEIQGEQSKLLEAGDGKRMDTRAAGTSGEVNPRLATLGTVNRTQVRRRKDPRIAERIQGGFTADASRHCKITKND